MRKFLLFFRQQLLRQAKSLVFLPEKKRVSFTWDKKKKTSWRIIWTGMRAGDGAAVSASLFTLGSDPHQGQWALSSQVRVTQVNMISV